MEVASESFSSSIATEAPRGGGFHSIAHDGSIAAQVKGWQPDQIQGWTADTAMVALEQAANANIPPLHPAPNPSNDPDSHPLIDSGNQKPSEPINFSWDNACGSTLGNNACGKSTFSREPTAGEVIANMPTAISLVTKEPEMIVKLAEIVGELIDQEELIGIDLGSESSHHRSANYHMGMYLIHKSLAAKQHAAANKA